MYASKGGCVPITLLNIKRSKRSLLSIFTKVFNYLSSDEEPYRKYLLRARRVKLLATVRKLNAKLFKSCLSVCVCLSVNNAARCTLPILSAIKPVPSHMYIGTFKVTLWLGHYCDART